MVTLDTGWVTVCASLPGTALAGTHYPDRMVHYLVAVVTGYLR